MARAAARRLGALGTLLLLVSCTGPSSDGNGAAGTFRASHPGVLTVATAEVPAAGFWEGTAARPTGGLEWALAEAMAKRFGLARVEVVEVPFADLVTGGLGGADLALSQLTPSPAREKVLAFSQPYLAAKPAILVRAGAHVDDMATARRQRWCVERHSTLESFLAGKVRPEKPVLSVDIGAQGLDAVTSGRVDAMLLDLPVAAAVAARSGGKLRVTAQFPADDSLAAALPKHSSNIEAVDSALRALTADGTLRGLAERWLGITVTGLGADEIPLISMPA